MKALLVVRREYLENVRKKSFVVATLLVPILMMAFVAVPFLLTFIAPDDQYNVVIVDETGVVGGEFLSALSDTLGDGRLKYSGTLIDVSRNDDERARQIAAVQNGDLDILVVLRNDIFEEGTAEYITRDVRNFDTLDYFEDSISNIVVKQRLARAGLDFDEVSALTARVRMELRQVSSSGELEEKNFLAEYGVVFIFVMILYMSLLTWGMTISRSIIEEKGSRIIEVLLSSVSARDLLLGKLIGVGLAGLTQMLIWSVVGLSLSAFTATAAMSMMPAINIPASVFGFLLLFYLLGFLLYAAMFTLVGAVCSTEQDAQQLQGVITMPLMIPLLTLMLIIQSPNSTAAVVLSMIPLFAPMVMVARIVLIEVAWWQILLTIGLLLGSIFGAIAFSSKVFRVGILMYGKRPNLKEMIRWYRQAD